MSLGPPDFPIHKSQAPVELCGSLVFPPVAGCDHLHFGMELEPPNYFQHGSSAIALSLEALVNHQATDEADSRAELVHRKTNHRHFRLLEAPGHDVIDGQGNEIRVRCGLLQGLRVWSRSEEHTSELQSRGHLVCALLLDQNSGGDTRLRRAVSRLRSHMARLAWPGRRPEPADRVH